MIGTGYWDVTEDEVLKLMHDEDLSYLEAVNKIENKRSDEDFEDFVKSVEESEEEYTDAGYGYDYDVDNYDWY